MRAVRPQALRSHLLARVSAAVVAALLFSGLAVTLTTEPAAATPTSSFADLEVYFDYAQQTAPVGGYLYYVVCIYNLGPGYGGNGVVTLSTATQNRVWMFYGASSGQTYCWGASIFAGRPGTVLAIANVTTLTSIDPNPLNNVAETYSNVYRIWGGSSG
jgi:hypothetical protein